MDLCAVTCRKWLDAGRREWLVFFFPRDRLLYKEWTIKSHILHLPAHPLLTVSRQDSKSSKPGGRTLQWLQTHPSLRLLHSHQVRMVPFNRDTQETSTEGNALETHSCLRLRSKRTHGKVCCAFYLNWHEISLSLKISDIHKNHNLSRCTLKF